MESFISIINKLPYLLDRLKNEKAYKYCNLTKNEICKIFKTNQPVAGVYLMYDKDKPVYVGRSKTIAQRIGTDHRALQKSQATLAYKLTQLNIEGISTMADARQYMFNNYTVKMLAVNDEYTRSLLEIYASMELNTEYNSFMEH